MSQKKLEKILQEGLQSIQKASNEVDLMMVEVRLLGRKSELSALLKGLKDLSPEEKRTLGPAMNAAKQQLTQSLAEKREQLQEADHDWEAERIDVTLPSSIGLNRKKRISGVGHQHPLTTITREIEDIFTSMGFEIADGPEVETEFYNFDALNMPADHPARDMQDTFWLQMKKESEDRFLLRTHTSPVQIRYMQTHTPPLRIIVPGRVFRNEATDTTHEHTFYQFECLMVSDDISVANFKAVGEMFFSRFFGQETTIRLRPSFFPFVEPGFEFDIACTLCHGVGCSACKQVGWIEIGGAGMVHQKVLVAAGYERDRYQGFAWGFGIPRLAMMKYHIPDGRLFQSGDLRFINQF
ncbi:MAG: phenylalanine--tRNA ligase subunit alpha [Candidatus Moraniibacteriota bacterium]